MNWYKLTVATVLNQLQSDPASGLNDAEVTARLQQYGPNELIDKGIKSPWLILFEQFTATMVLILIVAAVVSALLGDWLEAGAIFAIVILFGLLGFFQEYRAEQAMAALKKMAVPNVRVIRNGVISEIPGQQLVPGDITLLESGNIVPADLRLIESINLRMQEAALTGESEPVDKHIDAIDKADLTIGDRYNQAYMGTVVTYGRGKGVVTETGMNTQLGKIASLIQTTADDITPLQKRLDILGKQLAIIGVIAAAIVIAIGLWYGHDLREMFVTGVGIAVVVVPEGLPAAVTISLAIGAQRMLARQALIRKLPAVETLGSVTVICSDKTGTLTQNRMIVTTVEVANHKLDFANNTQIDAIPAQLVLASGALCNDANIIYHPQDHHKFDTIGDPTEGALLAAADRAGFNRAELASSFARVAELSFDSDRKRMTTFHEIATHDMALAQMLRAVTTAKYVALTKGAVDGLLHLSPKIWIDNQVTALTDDWQQRIQQAHEALAQNGIRVLGFALRFWDTLPTKPCLADENDLTFIGLVGMIDPPRPEVRAAVRTCQTAGIRTIMITGDHPLTASYIARDLGMSQNTRVITGIELNKMSTEQLRHEVEQVAVFARVSPEHKLNIVQALQDNANIAAMTGDGVNDAPALKRADIGVAMGITGTDVAKEASDMVLLDDNFATIVAAVEEGRVVYDNLRRFQKFSVAGNIGKVLVMILAPMIIGTALAMTALQLLWLNLITDGLLGLGMGFEPAEKNTMQRPPYSPQSSFLGGETGIQIAWVGLLTGLLTLVVGAWYCPCTGTDWVWQTMMFNLIAFLQIGYALAARSTRDSLFTLGLFSNKVLMVIVLIVVVLQCVVIYAPFMNIFMKTVPLSPMEFALCVLVGSTVFIAVEIEKLLRRRHES